MLRSTPATPSSPTDAATPPVVNPLIGAPMHHIPSGVTFTVLCSCPTSSPAHHTRRYIMRNPGDYRMPTVEEIQQWQTQTPPAK